MLPSEPRELKQLREENAKLKRLTDLSLDKAILREVVHYLMGRYGISQRRAARAARFWRARLRVLPHQVRPDVQGARAPRTWDGPLTCG